MARYTKTSLGSNYASKQQIDSNLDDIKTAIDDTLSRKGDSPNAMEADLDMNSNQILNLPDAVLPQEPITLSQFNAQSVGTKTTQTLKQKHVATAGQTVFTTPAYVIGSNNLSVYINGVRQDGAAYSETTTTSITLTEGAELSDIVEVLVNELPTSTDQVGANNVTYDGSTVAVHLDALTFDTVAAMVAHTDLQVGMKVKTWGYTTLNDGGGAEYEVVSAGTGTDDGGSFIDLTGSSLQAKAVFNELVNVKQFGATGDGSTDDTTAIQNCIDYGKNVYFGEGLTFIVTNISWSQSSVVYSGNSSLKLKNNIDTNISLIANNQTDITFEGLEFDGNGANQTGTIELTNGVVFPDNCQRIKFIDCYFHDFGPATKQPDNVNVSSDYNWGDGIVQTSSSATDNSDITIERCRFENCYAAVALRGNGDNIRVLNSDFKKCADNSIKTRTGAYNIVVDNCRDEDTRGAEVWGYYLRYTNNYSLNSHRHGVSGNLRNGYVAGNTFRHTTANLGSLYAIEIGLAEEARVEGNKIEDWDGEAAIALTDSAQASSGSIVSDNMVEGGDFVVYAIGSSNSQDNCKYEGNSVIDATGTALSIRGSNCIINDNIVLDSTGDLTNYKTATCLIIPVGSQNIICNNTFKLAGPWVSGDDFLSVMQGTFDNSIIKGNYMYGGRNSINGGLTNAIVMGNRIDSVEKVINSDSGSQDGVMMHNVLDNYTTLLDSGVYDGFSYNIQRWGQGSAAPTTGTWVVGDKVSNSTPSVDGNNMVLDHWVCTVAGTPGTWVAQYLSTVSPAT